MSVRILEKRNASIMWTIQQIWRQRLLIIIQQCLYVHDTRSSTAVFPRSSCTIILNSNRLFVICAAETAPTFFAQRVRDIREPPATTALPTALSTAERPRIDWPIAAVPSQLAINSVPGERDRSPMGGKKSGNVHTPTFFTPAIPTSRPILLGFVSRLLLNDEHQLRFDTTAVRNRQRLGSGSWCSPAYVQ